MSYRFWLILFMVGSLAAGFSGCKSKKKIAAEQAQEERERMIAKAKTDLLAILNDDGSMTLDQKERELDRIKALNIDDGEVQNLIRQVEAKLAKEREAADALEEREMSRRSKESQYAQVENYFNAIVNAPSVEAANRSINEALNLFASPEAPVLIIIYRQGTQVDYDEPTTIRKYLNYLKDQQRNINEVDNLVFDNSGKISAVELIRK